MKKDIKDKIRAFAQENNLDEDTVKAIEVALLANSKRKTNKPKPKKTTSKKQEPATIPDESTWSEEEAIIVKLLKNEDNKYTAVDTSSWTDSLDITLKIDSDTRLNLRLSCKKGDYYSEKKRYAPADEHVSLYVQNDTLRHTVHYNENLALSISCPAWLSAMYKDEFEKYRAEANAWNKKVEQERKLIEKQKLIEETVRQRRCIAKLAGVALPDNDEEVFTNFNQEGVLEAFINNCEINPNSSVDDTHRFSDTYIRHPYENGRVIVIELWNRMYNVKDKSCINITVREQSEYSELHSFSVHGTEAISINVNYNSGLGKLIKTKVNDLVTKYTELMKERQKRMEEARQTRLAEAQGDNLCIVKKITGIGNS